MNIHLYLYIILLLIVGQSSSTAQEKRWNITGKNKITWTPGNTDLPHADNIEMAGRKVVGIISYAVDTSMHLKLSRKIIFPQLHPFIKDSDPDWWIYRAYFTEEYDGDDVAPSIYIDDREFVAGPVDSVVIDGTLSFYHTPSKSGVRLVRHLFPSMEDRLFFEQWELQNTSDKNIECNTIKNKMVGSAMGEKGHFYSRLSSNIPSNFNIKSGDKRTFEIEMAAMIDEEGIGFKSNKDGQSANTSRVDFLNKMHENLILETPHKSLNTLFSLSKIRASESIFDSEMGLIHSPGGGRYYVGIWANDQAEYMSPLFPYLGYDIGNTSALNCYRAFAKEMQDDFKPIRYAFEIEGLVPPFMLDRGDAAMIAYGAAHFALALSDEAVAQELWPMIEWCLEYCHRQLNDAGVVMSESDEMEGRIETGDANLSTSVLYYGALEHAIDLARSLETVTDEKVVSYIGRMAKMDEAIETYFGANVEGLDTYRYYDGHTKLRHWICLPLVVGIDERKDATIEALFDRLWTENGVYVEKNSDDAENAKIFWDRGTLYAMRGTLAAGATEKTLDRLIEYSEKRMMGDRVPYVVEAYPEGAMAHLSAESGLYCRIFTEGLFGIKPIGLYQFEMTPRLPAEWDEMALRHIRAFGGDFDIEVRRVNKKIEIKIIEHSGEGSEYITVIKDGGTLKYEL